MIPLVVDWQINSECSRNCIFCYGPKNIEEMDIDNLLLSIKNINTIGAKIVGITGGEPLMHSKIEQIFKLIKEYNMAICLSTNGDFYKEKKQLILDYVDTIGLPIDGSNAKIHDKLRGNGNFNNVLYFLRDTYKISNKKYRIGTVVTSSNFDDLVNMAKLLKQFKDKIVYWKLYEYISYNSQDEYLNLSQNQSSQFKEVIKSMSEFFPEEKIINDTKEKRNRSYFLIKPNGDVFVPIIEENVSEEHIVGNITGNLKTLISRWKENINYDSYEKCYRCIFRKDDELKKCFLS